MNNINDLVKKLQQWKDAYYNGTPLVIRIPVTGDKVLLEGQEHDIRISHFHWVSPTFITIQRKPLTRVVFKGMNPGLQDFLNTYRFSEDRLVWVPCK